MKKRTIWTIGILLGIVVACFIAVLIFTKPAIFTSFDLSSKSSIGSTIGGITAPIIGIATAILLYLTLNRQIEANESQTIKNDSDIVFLLLNQLETEFSNIYYQARTNALKGTYNGVHAIDVFRTEFCGSINLQTYNEGTFASFAPANQLMLVTRSYDLISRRIKIAKLSSDMKRLFEHKLIIIYLTRLRYPLIDILKRLDQEPRLKDETSKTLDDFLHQFPDDYKKARGL